MFCFIGHVKFHIQEGVSYYKKTSGIQLFLRARVYGFMRNEPIEGLYHHLIVSLSYQNISHCPLHIVSLLKPRSLEQRARMNVGWLDSSLSIMEQVKYNRVIC